MMVSKNKSKLVPAQLKKTECVSFPVLLPDINILECGGGEELCNRLSWTLTCRAIKCGGSGSTAGNILTRGEGKCYCPFVLGSIHQWFAGPCCC